MAGVPPTQARPCPAGDDCVAGSTAAGEWLDCIVRLLMMTGEDAMRPDLHPWLSDLPHRPDRRPSPDAAELTGGLAGRPPRAPFGHDSSDSWVASQAIVKAAGLDPGTWGVCPGCEGRARHPDDAPGDWEPTEPPMGEGWQLWETTSEGSPASPVFATAEELADWCAGNASPFGSMRWTRDQWLRFTTEPGEMDGASLVVSVGGGPLTTLGTERDTREMEDDLKRGET